MQANNEKTVIALRAASTEVDVFVGSVLKEVKLIEKEYSDIVPDAESKEGYKFCKEVRKNVLPVKSRMEDARKSLKRPILDMGKLIDSSLNPLTDRLDAVYKPFEDAYRKKDNEKKIKEEKRQAIITKGFDRLNDSALEALGQTSIVIESIIDDLGDFDFDPDIYMERTDKAVRKHRELMGNLQNMLTAQIAAEDLQLRQKEIEEKEKQQKLEQEKANRDKRDAEIRAHAIKSAQVKADANAELAKETLRLAELKAEKDAKLAKEREKQAAIDAEIQAKKREEYAAKIERQRIADVKKIEVAEAKRREADKKHKAKIHREISTCIMATGITDKQAKAIITLAAKKCAGNMRISY